MGVVNFQKLFCQDLRAVAVELNPYDEVDVDFCAELRRIGIKDHVTIEDGADPGSMRMTYTSASGRGHLWLFDTGEVHEGALSETPWFDLHTLPLIVMGALFGTKALSAEGQKALRSDGVSASAIEYLRCLNQKKPARCVAEKKTFAARVAADNARRQEEADKSAKDWVKTDPELMEHLGLEPHPIHRIHGQYEIAKRIWQRIDTFITEAKQLDSNDSDLDILLEIVRRYSGARPVVFPTTGEAADQQCAYAIQMLKEFESGPALRSFVLDEGKFVRSFGNEGGSCSEYKISPYSFVQCHSESESERPIPDR